MKKRKRGSNEGDKDEGKKETKEGRKEYGMMKGERNEGIEGNDKRRTEGSKGGKNM